ATLDCRTNEGQGRGEARGPYPLAAQFRTLVPRRNQAADCGDRASPGDLPAPSAADATGVAVRQSPYVRWMFDPTARTMYSVLVDDNFHYQDKDDRYRLGSFPTYEDAEDACRQVVDRSLQELLRPGMTAEKLFDLYVNFGLDPFIPGEPFSAWEYAKLRAA